MTLDTAGKARASRSEDVAKVEREGDLRQARLARSRQTEGEIIEAAEEQNREVAGREVLGARTDLTAQTLPRGQAAPADIGQHDPRLGKGHEIEDIGGDGQAEGRRHEAGGAGFAGGRNPRRLQPQPRRPGIAEPVEESRIGRRARACLTVEREGQPRAGAERHLARAGGEGGGREEAGKQECETAGHRRGDFTTTTTTTSTTTATTTATATATATATNQGGIGAIDRQRRLCYPLSVAKAFTKELKKPDEFVSFWTHLGTKISENRRKVIAMVVTAAVVVAGSWGVMGYQASQAAKATVAFARIERLAMADLLPEKADAKVQAPKADEDQVPRFKTEKERLEAAIKEADAFVAAFGREGLGRKALLGKAGRLLAVGQPGEAAMIYETLAAGETDPGLRAVEQEGAGAASEAAGKLDDALRAYTALADSSQHGGTFYLDRALFAKARILEQQGKGKDAEQILREILTKVPKTPLRQQIDDHLAILAEK